MSTPLLDRQAELLRYLTSSSAIFGDQAKAPNGETSLGIDGGWLRLEARFSYEKRMRKITELLPNTFRLLGADRPALVRAFVDRYPPTHVGRLENARQFYDFLCTCWREQPPTPAYLPDVAACEISRARVRSATVAVVGQEASREKPRRGAVRRRPELILLRCDYDVRPIFEKGLEEAAPAKRDTRLAIVIPPDAKHPSVFELPVFVFDMLCALENWTEHPMLGTAAYLDTLRELAQHGLIEVAP